jgi:hypothetical protein
MTRIFRRHEDFECRQIGVVDTGLVQDEDRTGEYAFEVLAVAYRSICSLPRI